MINEIFYNYRKLLQTIYNTEIKDGKRGIICVYDIKDDEKLMGVFYTGEKCAKFLNVPIGKLYYAIHQKSLIKKRFRVERLDKDWKNE